MFSVNIHRLESMDHDPKRITTQKRVTIFLIKDHDTKMNQDLFSKGSQKRVPTMKDRSPTLTSIISNSSIERLMYERSKNKTKEPLVGKNNN